MFSALVLSDIHFVKPDLTDIDVELRNGLVRFLPTISKWFDPLTAILVCGDVAFRGTAIEYASAQAFLADILSPLGSPTVLVIPGNHDVDLTRADSAAQRAWRSTPRNEHLSESEREAELTKVLQEELSGTGLFEPLEAYNSFAATFGCEVKPSAPFWRRRLPIDARYSVEVRGLTSVLLSNSHDRKDRLVLGNFQLADLDFSDGVINVTMCHHPYNWLLDGEPQRHKIRHRSTLHITGHEHTFDLLIDPEVGSLHFCSGALQPTRQQSWEPRLHALGLEVDESGSTPVVNVAVYSAIWSSVSDSFVQDFHENYAVNVRLEQLASLPRREAPDQSQQRLVQRLALLQSGDRLDVAKAISMDLGDLSEGMSYEIPKRVVQFALDHGQLHKLWEEVHLRHGKQAGETNPFRSTQ